MNSSPTNSSPTNSSPTNPSYELGRMPRILIGETSLSSLFPIFWGWETLSIVLIIDQAMANTDYLQKIKESLKKYPIGEHIVPAGEPTIESVNAAALFARSYPRTVIIGIGGGSVLDTAKQVAAIVPSHEGIEHYLLAANPFPGRRHLIAIPTTAGTGAEVTRTCIVSDANGRKMWTWGDEMLPDVVILDAAVTATVPAPITAATGLDALVHALEANTGQRKNAISSAAALQAIRLVRRHLPAAVRNGQDLEARAALQQAALLAGTAIDNAGTGIAHCIGHALGTLYKLPHGIAVTLALEASLEWNIAGASEVYKDAADVFHVKPHDLPTAFKRLLEDSHFVDAVRGLKDVNLDANAIADTMNAPENQPMLNNNARAVSEADRLELAKQTVLAWHRIRA
jgi:alcohol dehydrogenase